MATKFAIANAAQRASSRLRRSKTIARIANRLDRCVGPELLAQSANADVDDVRAGIEVVSPDLGQQALAADHFPRVLEQVMQHPKLAVRELCRHRAEPSFA